MLITARKSKYKHKITIPYTAFYANKDDRDHERDMRVWCENRFGPGGRKERWRFGWTQKDSTFYFRQASDATMFTLKWSA